MAKMVLLITPRVELVHDLGDAWEKAGAPGITFIEGYGLLRLKEATQASGVLPGMMSMFEILRSREQSNMTMFSVVEDESVVDRLIKVSHQILDNLERPNNGVIFVINVEQTVGVRSV
jgi:nitrogen regulatory protein PII